MYVVTVRFEIEPEMAAAFLGRMRRQAADSLRLEPGCRRFEICLDPPRPERVFLYEIYDDRAAFESHLASPHFRDFDRAVAPMVTEKTVEIWALDPGA
ncbi:putative quinol monooxygenase [Paralimibaculum aggregatum]|uniref:Quinol monooxygenase n=1 Tax=Paralimibaculum aggregatum TaxID=3036245 RepID=A0ABQ6LQZ1_9RHOB|nr:putative quinol monooxygenase [Limibaculum sp. NKW23]GMG84607.1 putative quinol monooxygenase [Limibaculum sp. NKW23]